MISDICLMGGKIVRTEHFYCDRGVESATMKGNYCRK